MQPASNKCWEFTRKYIEESSPSRKDGLPLRKENSQRRLALAFTQDVGASLKMNQYTIATAFVYWQRFFMRQSLLKQDPYLVASACLLLAGKVEENFKSLQKITETSYFVKNKKDPKAMDAFKVNPKLLATEMDKVVRAEEFLLWTINFDFFVYHPYKPLCAIVKDLGHSNKSSEEDRNFFQVAWNFANDSFRTALCLQPVRAIDVASACINLSATVLNMKLSPAPDGGPWWTKYDVKPEILQDIEVQIMSLYKRKDGDSSKTPTSCFSLPATPSLSTQPQKKQRVETPSPPSGTGSQPEASSKEPAIANGTSGTAHTEQGGLLQSQDMLKGTAEDVKAAMSEEGKKDLVLVECSTKECGSKEEAKQGGALSAAEAASGTESKENVVKEYEESSEAVVVVKENQDVTRADKEDTGGERASDGLELTDELMQELEDVQPSKITGKRLLETTA